MATRNHANAAGCYAFRNTDEHDFQGGANRDPKGPKASISVLLRY